MYFEIVGRKGSVVILGIFDFDVCRDFNFDVEGIVERVV